MDVRQETQGRKAAAAQASGGAAVSPAEIAEREAELSEMVLALGDDLRQMGWEARILRDHLLKLLEDLPPAYHEKARQTVENLNAFCLQVREIAASLPSCVQVDTLDDVNRSLAEMRVRIERAQRGYLKVAITTLHEIPWVRPREKHDPERVH
jgi:hypothetical protein